MKNKNTGLYLAGGIFGAAVGLAAIYLLEKASEMDGEDKIFNTKTLTKVGKGTLSLLYSLIGKGKGRGRIV